jgi:hypothetical protein
MADDNKISKEEAAELAGRAKIIFQQIGAILKNEHPQVVGAATGMLLASYLASYEFMARDEAVNRLMSLVSSTLRDIDKANGVDTTIEFQVGFDDTIREQMEKNPKMAEFVRESTARVRQALDEYQAGKYASIDEAMTAIGLSQVDPEDVPEDMVLTERRKLS